MLKVKFKADEFEVKNKRIINESKFVELNPDYFKQFEDVFMTKVKELIKISQSKSDMLEDLPSEDHKLVNEVLVHLDFGKHLNERFLGRTEILDQVIL